MRRFVITLRCLFAVIIAVLLFVPQSVHAQSTYFWRSSGDGNNSGNWQGNNTQWWLSGGNTSGFAFGIQWWDNNNFLTQTNNTANASTHAFHFTANANSGFTFVGSSVRLFDSGGNDPFIRNASGATHTFNFNLSADGNTEDPLFIYINGAGGLTFNGTKGARSTWKAPRAVLPPWLSTA
jgi:hypothetical protein